MYVFVYIYTKTTNFGNGFQNPINFINILYSCKNVDVVYVATKSAA